MTTLTAMPLSERLHMLPGDRAQSPAQLLARLPLLAQQELLQSLSTRGQSQLRWDWRFWARPAQLPPSGAWRFWLVSSGRGGGKTRSGAEWIRLKVAQGAKRIGLVAETAGDVRDVLVEGHSGLLSVYPPTDKPLYEPSKRRITWRNGAVAQTYSGDSPEQLRGPNHEVVWSDETAKYQYLEDCFANLDLGLRLGDHPQCMFTTTPRPSAWLRRMLAEARSGAGRVILTQESTYANAVNLSPDFIAAIRERYEGTRLGRQEIHAELLDEHEFALWSYGLLESCRVLKAPPLQRVVVGVDPGHDAGIIVAGLGEDGEGYVLEDCSLSGTPADWARQAVSAYHRHGANSIILEKNHGGEMAASTVRTIDPTVPIRTVWASQGKYARAEPVSALYEQHRCHHVGLFAALEDEQTSWAPGEGQPSPNRLDALVWAITDLLLTGRMLPEINLGEAFSLTQANPWDLG